MQLSPLKVDSCVLVRLSFGDEWGRGGAYTGFWWGRLRERDHLGDPGVDRGKILKWIFRKRAVGLWTGSSWLRIVVVAVVAAVVVVI